MTTLTFDPDMVSTAASTLSRIGSSISDANAAARAGIISILPAGADEVSTAISALFNGHGLNWQQVVADAQAFHEEFVANLAAAKMAYQDTEFAALQALWNAVTKAEQPIIPLLDQLLGSIGFGTGQLPTPPLPTAPVGQTIALLLGGTGYPVLGGWYPGVIQSQYFPSITSFGSIFTPEQFWPITPWLGGLTLGQSIAQGAPLLNTAINTVLAHGNPVLVWTTSQSSTVATLEIRNLMAMGSPNVGNISFFLTGNPDNPNGGMLERFVGAYIPGLDLYGYGATPPNSPYHTVIFTNQYDGVGDFPQHIGNVVSDANAIAGFLWGDHDYAPTGSSQIYQLPTSPGYSGNTTYLYGLENQVPLLNPMRGYGVMGNALADLIQPDLRVIVDMGYQSNQYANIPTPADLFGIPNVPVVAQDLLTGAVQGTTAFGVDMGWLPHSAYPTGYPMNPVLNPNVNITMSQQSQTGLSTLFGFEGTLLQDLGFVPNWI